jgi:hypothetical protein
MHLFKQPISRARPRKGQGFRSTERRSSRCRLDIGRVVELSQYAGETRSISRRTQRIFPDSVTRRPATGNLVAAVRLAHWRRRGVSPVIHNARDVELPILRRAPTHFVTWGDGSSDEMCLGLTWIAPRMPEERSSI